MGHQQQPTPMLNDNFTAEGIINKNFKQHRTHTIDMCFYWTHRGSDFKDKAPGSPDNISQGSDVTGEELSSTKVE
eukprot:15311842-Ditylum_brightwellii.AAC.1